MRVQDALQDYYQNHSFGDEARTQKWATVPLGPFKIPFPNLKKRREVIHLHDIHHLLTAYETDWTGEGELAAWEIASGFTKKYWIGYCYAPIALAIGGIISPTRAFRAFQKGWGKKNLFHMDLPEEKLMAMQLSELQGLFRQI